VRVFARGKQGVGRLRHCSIVSECSSRCKDPESGCYVHEPTNTLACQFFSAHTHASLLPPLLQALMFSQERPPRQSLRSQVQVLVAARWHGNARLNRRSFNTPPPCLCRTPWSPPSTFLSTPPPHRRSQAPEASTRPAAVHRSTLAAGECRRVLAAAAEH
jgi:hypothetical protein